MRKTESSNERSKRKTVLILTALPAYPAIIHFSFAFFLNYVFVLLLFVIEYQLRLYCLPSHEHLSFRAFCRLLACTDLRALAR